MNRKLILASGSPRRQEMLRFLKVPFETVVTDAPEDWPLRDSAVGMARGLAVRKAQSVQQPNAVVVAMDSIVAIGREKLGKPEDAADARKMLRLLSGRTHRVITGVAIRTGKKEVAAAEITRVHFRSLRNSEIEFYIDSGEPFGKAGAYAIQGVGRLFIDRIEGDYYNVVGFPLALFLRCLDSIGISIYELMK